MLCHSKIFWFQREGEAPAEPGIHKIFWFQREGEAPAEPGTHGTFKARQEPRPIVGGVASTPTECFVTVKI